MDKKYKVTVIVPVYNVEKYLEKCLDSLVHQTLESLQIIVVNDGSTDNSQEIIDRFVKKYPEKVFGYKKQNGGLGDARNYGMQYAEGEFISFVDSDDWVDEKMFAQMYDFAIKGDYQIVISDMYCINDGWTTGHIAKEYRGENPYPTIEDYMLYCLEPAHACGKIYYYQLLAVQEFPKIWYEDMATIPVVMSYAERIGYLQMPFYYYRQREGSITQQTDIRTLQVMQAWDNIISNVNKLYLNEVIAAVYKSIETFITFKPEYAKDFLEYAKERKEIFLKNAIVQKRIEQGKQENLIEKQLIPHVIHYFWFGHGPKTELFKKCYESWKKYAPGFEIKEWNESNSDIFECAYVKEAYEAKKWAFVADYFRIKKIHEYGGIYVDTDVEFMSSIIPLTVNNTFFAFETKKYINAAIFGAVSHASILKKWLDTYKNDHLLKKDGSLDTSNTIVKRLTKILKSDYGVHLNGQHQKIQDGIVLYQPNELTLDMYDGKCIAQHHYEATWWDVKIGNTSYKQEVLRDYFQEGGADNDVLKQENVRLNIEIEQLKNSTSWKLTRPVRWLGDLLKRNKV